DARLHEGERQREHEGVVAEFGDHRLPFNHPNAKAWDASLRRTSRRGAEFLFVVVLPMTLLLQGVSDVLRHISLVVFGEYAIGAEDPAWVESTLGNHALPFAEKIRQKAAVGHRHGTLAVSHLKTNSEPIAAQNAALLHQAADAQARPGFDLLFHQLGWRIEEDDGVFERAEHQRHREREDAEGGADNGEASLLASHHSVRGLSFPDQA